MQMLDVNTNSPPLSIVRIEVEQLFGRYNYTLTKENNHGVLDSSLMILYGDNGSGKTTILKLLFHLLSASHRRGHRTFLAQTSFLRFSVFLADGTRIIASREKGNFSGSFKLHISAANNIQFIEDIQADSDNTVKALQQGHIPGYEFYKKISQLQLSLFFLGDNRILNSDVFSSEDIGDEKTFRRILSNIGDTLEDKVSINREYALAISIHRTEEWIREQALVGANQGDANVHNIYEEIITRILQNSKNLVEEELPQSPKVLINDLITAEKLSKDFSRFGLMSALDNKRIVHILQSNHRADYSIISRVLEPYLDSLTARFKALQNTQNLLTIFENTINNLFFRDKYIKLHVRDGLKIFTDKGKELSPEMLSSGEKQLLLLFCNTLTARDKATIFIIDEPEISLNVKWQRQLIKALLELTQGSQVQFILATHSIELLSQYKNNVIKLVKTEK